MDSRLLATTRCQIGFLDGVSVPSISNTGLALLCLLVMAATGWMLRRADYSGD